MITRFEVKNFQGFDHLIFDLKSDKRYDFNTHLIKDKIVNSSLVFGKNGSGKTTLSFAIMDIIYCISNSTKATFPDWKYINANAKVKEVFFKYNFDFDGDKVEYEYVKSSQNTFVYEKLFVNNKLIIYRNVLDSKNDFIKIKGFNSLKTSSCPNFNSIINYIFAYSLFEQDEIIYKLIMFVNKMSVLKFNQERFFLSGYLTLKNGTVDRNIIEENKLSGLQSFLNDCGIKYNLVPYKIYSDVGIGVKFNKETIIPLVSIASSGTLDLIIYYYYSTFFNESSLIILDEFDSTYQYNIAKKIYKSVSSLKNVQSVLTTHNLLLLDNDYTRPDCLFYLNNNKIKPFSSLCDVNIRKNNNLLKMYLDGKFNLDF